MIGRTRFLRFNKPFLFLKMKTKTQKTKDLAKLNEAIPEADITIFASFSRKGEKGLSVSQITELRRLLRQIGSKFIVTKKTLIDLAFKQLKKEIDVFGMNGSIGLAVGKGDAYAIAKKIFEFARKNQALQFFGAMYDGKFIGADEFVEMAKMPSRDALIGRLLGMMKYPLSSLAIVLNEICKKKVPTT